jgi:hypothetical protein
MDDFYSKAGRGRRLSRFLDESQYGRKALRDIEYEQMVQSSVKIFSWHRETLQRGKP